MKLPRFISFCMLVTFGILNTLVPQAFGQISINNSVQQAKAVSTIQIQKDSFQNKDYINLNTDGFAQLQQLNIFKNTKELSSAFVSITDSNRIIRNIHKNHFGYFRLEDLQVGKSLNFNTRHKSYQFTPEIITITESINNLNFREVQLK